MLYFGQVLFRSDFLWFTNIPRTSYTHSNMSNEQVQVYLNIGCGLITVPENIGLCIIMLHAKTLFRIILDRKEILS